ncbi:GtrA family protein [Microvirga zambiensis]|uniref:GtrA family protein n=1 Tax=Microvirga zambiensis TaxID=1402137 RepID=UPI003CCD19EC
MTCGLKNRFIRQEKFLQFVRFLASGFLATALYFLIFAIFTLAYPANPTANSAVSYSICIFASYLLQSRYTFKARERSALIFLKFVLTSMLGFLLSIGVMAWTVRHQSLSYWIGALAVGIIIPIVNFFVLSLWVFVERGTRTSS